MKEQQMTLQISAESRENFRAAQALPLKEAVDRIETKAKQRGRPFERGAPSPNPSGRPKGVYSTRSGLLRKTLATAALPVLKKMIEVAKSGDVQAARLILARTAPAERTVSLDLPRVHDAASALAALEVILAAVGKGELTVPEASALGALIKNFLDIDGARQLEERMAAIEARLAESQ